MSVDDPKKETTVVNPSAQESDGVVDGDQATVTISVDDLDEILDDGAMQSEAAASPGRRSGLTLDETEQERRSLELLDRIFDDGADAEIERDGPIDQRGIRLSVAAHRMVDEMERHMSDGRPEVVDESDPLGSRRIVVEELGATDGRPVAAHDPDKVDTARIRRMQRDQLVRLVARLSTLRGEAPPSCDGLSEEQLQEMARRLRSHAQA